MKNSHLSFGKIQSSPQRKWLLLQTHSVKSAELVAIISSFRGAIQDAVRSHHERWDGHGYP